MPHPKEIDEFIADQEPVAVIYHLAHSFCRAINLEGGLRKLLTVLQLHMEIIQSRLDFYYCLIDLKRIIVEAPPAPQPVVVHREREREQRHEPHREEDVYYRRHEVRDSGHPEDDYVSERNGLRLFRGTIIE